jgi:hypothetical protein
MDNMDNMDNIKLSKDNLNYLTLLKNNQIKFISIHILLIHLINNMGTDTSSLNKIYIAH